MSKIRIERLGGEDGIPSITIDQEALDCLAKGWRHFVVIKLLGKPLAFHVLDRKIREMWKSTGSFVIVDLPYGYSINFYGALTGGPWTIFGQCLMVKHWMHRLLSRQPYPSRQEHLACHEGKPLQASILVNGEQIVVEYECLGEVCIGYGKQGHLVNRCPLFTLTSELGKAEKQ
ncbi:hypothetical protein V2J09_003956 [Rumex salicifolius]